MLESTVLAQVPQHPAVVVQAGQRTRITDDGVGQLTSIDAASVQDAWRARQLVVDDQPLAEVLDELARHRPGQLHYDRAQIAGIRVAAVLAFLFAVELLVIAFRPGATGPARDPHELRSRRIRRSLSDWWRWLASWLPRRSRTTVPAAPVEPAETVEAELAVEQGADTPDQSAGPVRPGFSTASTDDELASDLCDWAIERGEPL